MILENSDSDFDNSIFLKKSKKNGRPVDVWKDLPLEEQRIIYNDMHRRGIPLTLDQTRIAMWNPKTEKAPITRSGTRAIENRALAKLKLKLKQLGITRLDDVLNLSKRREFASYGSTSDVE